MERQRNISIYNSTNNDDDFNDFSIVSPTDLNESSLSSETANTSATLEDALHKLQELARENITLKEYLRSLNEQLKSQLSMLNSVKAAHEKELIAVKQRFDQLQTAIFALKEENAGLRKALQKSENETSYSDINKLPDEEKQGLSKLNKEIQRQEKRGLIQQEKQVLGKDQRGQQHAKQNKEPNSLQAQMLSMLREVEEARRQIRQMTDEKYASEQRSAVLERKIEAYESRLSDFQSKKNGDLEALRIIAELENKLQEKENESKNLETRLNIVEHNYRILRQQFEYQNGCQEPSQIRKHKEKVEDMEEQLQLSHGVKMSLESEVEKLNAELKQARDHMNKMSTDIREYVQKIDQYENQVILLQFQAEVYHADFDAERSSREKIQEEKEHYREKATELEIINKQLQYEISSIAIEQMSSHREQQASHPRPHHHPPATGEDVCDMAVSIADMNEQDAACDEQDEPVLPDDWQRFHCPRCQSSFPDVDNLHSHFAKCSLLHRHALLK